jgi:hypothetical protein
MEYYLWFKYAHILAFVYWLGGDLGTFFASGQVVRRDIGVEARQVALKIMLACDQGPKLAMPAIFVFGFQMAYGTGLISVPLWLVAVVWLAGAAWFANVIFLHLGHGSSMHAFLTRWDFRFRLLVVALLLGWALGGLAGYSAIAADWLSWKVLVYVAMICCGLMIRLNLRPFVPAFAETVQHGATDERNKVLEDSLGRCRPWVYAIWLGLFLNSAIGLHLI